MINIVFEGPTGAGKTTIISKIKKEYEKKYKVGFTNDIDKSSLVFVLPHKEGSLSQVLSVLSFYDINLTRIQSLPIVGTAWEYQFYIDLSFSDYERYKQSLKAIIPLVSNLKVLGEYVADKQFINK